MTEIWQWSALDTAARVAAGEVSAREVTDAHLTRLADVNPPLNAVTNEVGDEARAAAADLDDVYTKVGPIGPLHGVPVTIKENIDVKGQVTPNGLPAFAELVAPTDSPLVGHLRAAGAVIVGRTNTPEMSYRWHTTNPLRGTTTNPWSPARTPGGSSGGAAASLAAGIGAIAHGNDLGGSLRQPANCCGLTTIRPSLGRIPSHNATAAAERSMGLQLMAVQGPIARTVADARLGLEIMMQPDPRDPWHRPAPLAGPAARGPLRVAVTHGSPRVPTDADVVAAVDEAARLLDEAGYAVEAVDPPALDEILAGWRSILSTETTATLGSTLAEIGSEEFLAVVGWMFEGSTLDLAGYVAALTRRNTHLRAWSEFLDRYPLVVAPVSQRVPFAPNADAASREGLVDIMTGHTPLVAVNYLGLPAAAVPVTLTDDGPIGVQIIGQPFREDRCLDAAQAIEHRVGVMIEHLWARSA
ncbi:MAG: amidase [Acidimicrobiales bacterium]